MLPIKILLQVFLILIAYQDIKNREVSAFLFPLTAFCFGYLFWEHTLLELFITYTIINIVFVTILLLIVWAYSRFKMKLPMSATFGAGDICMFYALTVSYASVSFITIFVFSLLFSLLLHWVIRKNSHNQTVPLAGYVSIFFSITYFAYWIGIIDNLYVM